MLPVVAMWGHLCGFDITATTAMPEAVRTGLARSLHDHQGHGTMCAMDHVQLMDGASPTTVKVVKLEVFPRSTAADRRLLWQQYCPVFLRHCCNDVHKLWCFCERVFERCLQVVRLEHPAIQSKTETGCLFTSRFTMLRSTSEPALTPDTNAPTISAIALTRAYTKQTPGKTRRLAQSPGQTMLWHISETMTDRSTRCIRHAS